jgi:hypothetical protein
MVKRYRHSLHISVAELDHFYAAPALSPGKNFYAAPALPPGPTLPYSRPTFTQTKA